MDGFAAGGVPFRLEMPRVELTKDYSQIAVREFDLEFGGFEAEGGVEGAIADPVKVAGTVRSNVFDLRALLTSVGIEAPKTTDPQALTRLQVETAWSLDAGAVGIDPLKLAVDDTHFEGAFRRGSGADPVGEFTLRGDALNLSRYIPPTDPQSEPFLLPTAMLESLKFRGTLQLEQVTLDDVVMKGVTLRLVLDEQGLRSVAAGP
jgi:AsmA protein